MSNLKPIDHDLAVTLEAVALDAEINASFQDQFGPMGGELDEIAATVETTVRRLAREAGYALPETVCGD
jgi:hypothetical protein